MRFVRALISVTRDYVRCFTLLNPSNKHQKSGRYYKPWKPANPTVIVSSKQEIAELSEAAKLSQRAVYADVSRPAAPGVANV